MLECVVNISEGQRPEVIAALETAVGPAGLDVHSDADHHRSVFTVAGPEAARALTDVAVELLDIRDHQGVHPRFGVVDVVPFVPLGATTMAGAVTARDAYAWWAATTYGLPCFLYGPERTLPEVRRRAFEDLAPDIGPPEPHPTAGAVAVGARPPLVAYNLWLTEPNLALADDLARSLRSPSVRALALSVGEEVQVSINLVAPEAVGPADVYDAVAARTRVAHAELVGLVPRAVLKAVPRGRWEELDLDDERTIESRLAQAGYHEG